MYEYTNHDYIHGWFDGAGSVVTGSILLEICQSLWLEDVYRKWSPWQSEVSFQFYMYKWCFVVLCGE